MKKGSIIYLIVMTGLALSSCKGKKEIEPPKPMSVPVVQVMQQNVALESEYTGQTYGESDVEIRTCVDPTGGTYNYDHF